MRGSTNSLLIRITLIAVVVACGALAIAQAQRSLQNSEPQQPSTDGNAAAASNDKPKDMIPIELNVEPSDGHSELTAPPPSLGDPPTFDQYRLYHCFDFGRRKTPSTCYQSGDAIPHPKRVVYTRKTGKKEEERSEII